MTTTCPHLKIWLAGVTAIALTSTNVMAKAPTTAELHKALIAARAEAEWPGLTAHEAAKTLKTADAALTFVRDGIHRADYRGSLQGPAGVLKTRTANQQERAGLLAALLYFQGYEVQLQSIPVTSDMAMHSPAGLNRERPSLARLKALLATTPSTFAAPDMGKVIADDKNKTAALLKEVESASEIVKSELARHQWKAASVSAASSVKADQLVFVRARKGKGAWRTFDPSTDSATLPDDATRPKFNGTKMTIAVVYKNGPHAPMKLLTWNGSSAELAGNNVTLGWVPMDKRIKSAKDLTLPVKLQIAQWVPLLQIGKKQVRGVPVALPTKVLPGQRPSLRIRISINENGKIRSYNRALQDLGAGFDQHEMFSSHHIGFAAAGFPAEAIDARILDELADVSAHCICAKGGPRPAVLSAQRAFSTRTAIIVNQMIRTALAIDPTGKNISWQGPAIFIESSRLQKRGNDFFSFTMLDMLSQAFAPVPSAPSDLKIRWGLAVCAAEAQLVSGKSVNQNLIASGQPLNRVTNSQRDDLVSAALADKALVFSSTAADQYAWAVKPDGTLLGFVSDRPLIQAKGGNGPRTPEQRGADAFRSAASAMNPLSPTAALAGGLAGYLNELRKAWLGAAGKMNGVAAMIAGEAPPQTDLYDFNNFHRQAVAAFVEGFANAYAASLVTRNINAATGAGRVGSTLTGIGVREYFAQNGLNVHEIQSAVLAR